MGRHLASKCLVSSSVKWGHSHQEGPFYENSRVRPVVLIQQVLSRCWPFLSVPEARLEPGHF